MRSAWRQPARSLQPSPLAIISTKTCFCRMCTADRLAVCSQSVPVLAQGMSLASGKISRSLEPSSPSALLGLSWGSKRSPEEASPGPALDKQLSAPAVLSVCLFLFSLSQAQPAAPAPAILTPREDLSRTFSCAAWLWATGLKDAVWIQCI